MLILKKKKKTQKKHKKNQYRTQTLFKAFLKIEFVKIVRTPIPKFTKFK